MPVSIWNGMEQGLSEIVGCQPDAVLDAGIGFGLWGCLLRQYLDVWFGRIQPYEWRTRIDGIEVDPARVQAHARLLYTDILIGDIRDVVPRRATEVRYDVILFGDVIEHLPKHDGRALLDVAASLAGKLVVARIPFGDGWRREGRTEPDHHRSQWYADDFAEQTFAGRTGSVREYDYHGNPYGLVTIPGVATDRDASGAGAISELELRLDQLERRIEELARS
jgi:hypothetical protein